MLGGVFEGVYWNYQWPSTVVEFVDEINNPAVSMYASYGTFVDTINLSLNTPLVLNGGAFSSILFKMQYKLLA